MRVLFIDEDQDVDVFVRVMASQFREHAFSVACDLDEAWENLCRQKYDAVVVDMWMPGDEKIVPGSSREAGLLSGKLLIEKFRNSPACINKATPYLIYTAVWTEEESELSDFLRENAERWVRKPVKPSDMMGRIMKIGAAR